MKPFAFISRHTPTKEQVSLAADLDIELIHCHIALRPPQSEGRHTEVEFDTEDAAVNFAADLMAHVTSAQRGGE